MKQIQGYVNYFIDINGAIYNSITKKYINPSNNHSGYKVITLYKNGIKKQYRLNRLVAECYLLNLDGKTQVNHKNGIKSDNNINNLEWCTPYENNMHAYKTGLKKGKTKGKLVVNLENGIFYNSAKEAALSSNIKLGTFVGYLNGNYKNKTSYVYV
jgi:hypothetical protein